MNEKEQKAYDEGHEDGIEYEKRYGYGSLHSKIVLILTGLLIGLLIMLFVSVTYDDPRIGELGFAICDQEYNMDYQSYEYNQLECKPRFKEQYDGITVKLR